MNAYTQQYQQNQINMASPEQILIMLYDGAIRFTRQAMMGIETDNVTMKSEGIRRSMAIVSEFANTLDHEVGGDIAANLDGLYSFMIREFTAANLNNDVEKLKVVEGLLVELRETWAEAIVIARKEATGNVATEPPEDHKPLTAAG